LTHRYLEKTKGTDLRDANVRGIWKEGRKEWKISSDYHKRSLVENTMYRFKTIFGSKMLSRKMPRQKTEKMIKIRVLNRMTEIGNLLPRFDKFFKVVSRL
jgi:hypothetical protein